MSHSGALELDTAELYKPASHRLTARYLGTNVAIFLGLHVAIAALAVGLDGKTSSREHDGIAAAHALGKLEKGQWGLFTTSDGTPVAVRYAKSINGTRCYEASIKDTDIQAVRANMTGGITPSVSHCTL